MQKERTSKNIVRLLERIDRISGKGLERATLNQCAECCRIENSAVLLNKCLFICIIEHLIFFWRQRRQQGKALSISMNDAKY